MINREDAIDNLKLALKGECSVYVEDYEKELIFAINDMKDMRKIRKYMLEDEAFETKIENIIRS